MLSANIRFMGAALAIFTIAQAAATPQASTSTETHPGAPSVPPVAASSCPGSAPEPNQSDVWSVAFCNRTGHDVVLEFHDNDCPAKDWSRRGDVYQRMLHKGESKTFPLCYANEPAGKKPAPGVPTLRIPGGKGVVTTWSVVGDCGEHSRPLNRDAQTFYDRGEYKSGIVLLQYPAGAGHCAAEGVGTPAAGAASASAAASTPGGTGAPGAGGTAAGPGTSGASSAPGTAGASAAAGGHATAGAPGTTGTTGTSAATGTAGAAAAAPLSPPATPPPPPAAPPINTRGSGAPTLSAAIETKDVIARTVRVFAKDGAGYKCAFNLALTFSDGGSWNDHGEVSITAGDADAPVATRKYLKTVSKVQLTSSKCAPM